MGLSAFYGAPESDEKRFEVLDRAYELGETFWDSADMYQDSEDLIGKWFKRTGKRHHIFLATKVSPILLHRLQSLTDSSVSLQTKSPKMERGQSTVRPSMPGQLAKRALRDSA
jgi:aryl-alcohol dehydrogenase-like predicted oxidoreductase